MEFNVEAIPRLSDSELKNLIVSIITARKVAKKKLQKLIKGDGDLMNTWIQTLSLDPVKALPEEVAAIRKERQESFELALASNPDAFVVYQTSVFLLKMLEQVRAENMTRLPPPKRRR